MSGSAGARQAEQQRAERRVLAGPRDARDERLEVVEELLVRVEVADELASRAARAPRPARSSSSLRFASRSAFSRYSSSRVGTIGHAPTSVCQTRYSSFGSSMPPVSSRQRRTRSAHSSCMPASAPMRARTSPARFVSCVCEASSVRGWRSSRSSAARWNSSGREREAAGVAADLVQRGEPEPAVERGVLDALRHHRRRSSAASATTNSSSSGERSPSSRTTRRRSSGSDGARLAGPRRSTRPSRARRTCGRRAARPPPPRARRAGRARGAARTPARTSSAPPRASPRARPRRTCRRSPVSSAYSSVSGSSPAGSTKSAVDVVRELVAGRALDRPVRAQRLARLEDLLDPDRARRRARAAARGTRAGSRARRDGRCAGRRRGRRRRARAPSRASPRRPPGSSTRTPRELADVEEAAVPAASRGPSRRTARAAPGRARSGSPPRRSPCGSGRRRGSCRGRPSCAASQSARSSVLAAELGRDARRVDDVVAVRRAGSRLQRRREVEVRDAELADVREDDLARARGSRARGVSWSAVACSGSRHRRSDAPQQHERVLLHREQRARAERPLRRRRPSRARPASARRSAASAA